MLMPTGLFPAASPALGPDPPPDPFEEAPEPPGVPAPLPSGETATRAARFPLGTSTMGAGGAGVADKAIIVADGPPAAPAFSTASSGARSTSPFFERSASRGAEPALISSLGRAGPLVTSARLISAGRNSRFGTSGVGVSVVALRFTCFGRSFAKVCSLISRRGWAGPEEAASWTMLGSAGKNFGGSMGSEALTKVCRGCVG